MSSLSSLHPIFVVGSGRSGTTLLFELLRGQHDLAWISRLTDRLPFLPQLASLSRISALSRYRAFQPSTDSARTYRHCGITADLLREKGRSLTGDDLTPESADKLRRIVNAHARAMRKTRFINKSTMNTMRVRLIQEVFPDAYFVHIIRNGYAVSASLVRVQWWPDTDIWWLGKTPREWEAGGGDPYELAAMNWRRQVGEILEQKRHIAPGRFAECRYEELLSNPVEVVSRIMDFCGLRWTDECRRHVRKIDVDPANRDKWRRQLGAGEKATIHRIAGDLLVELGYESPV